MPSFKNKMLSVIWADSLLLSVRTCASEGLDSVPNFELLQTPIKNPPPPPNGTGILRMNIDDTSTWIFFCCWAIPLEQGTTVAKSYCGVFCCHDYSEILNHWVGCGMWLIIRLFTHNLLWLVLRKFVTHACKHVWCCVVFSILHCVTYSEAGTWLCFLLAVFSILHCLTYSEAGTWLCF